MSEARDSGLKRTLRVVRPHLGGQKLLMAGGSVSLLAEVVFRVLEPWPSSLHRSNSPVWLALAACAAA